MIVELAKRIFNGIAVGGLVTFIALTFLMLNDVNPKSSIIWLYMLASFFFGVYFAVSSYIFAIDHWSPLKQTTVHFVLSITIYYSIAIPIGWVPLAPIAIFGSAIIFIIIYAIFWSGYAIYYRKLEASLNESLPNKK